MAYSTPGQATQRHHASHSSTRRRAKPTVCLIERPNSRPFLINIVVRVAAQKLTASFALSSVLLGCCTPRSVWAFRNLDRSLLISVIIFCSDGSCNGNSSAIVKISSRIKASLDLHAEYHEGRPHKQRTYGDSELLSFCSRIDNQARAFPR